MSATDRTGFPKRVRRTCAWVWVSLHLLATALNAATWQSFTGGRSQLLQVPSQGKTGFSLLPAQATGIAFTNVMPEERHLTNQILLNGSGVAAGDIDGDGRCDLYFCSLTGPNHLFRNRGQLQFEDVPQANGAACDGLNSSGAAFADLDGDGDLDLLVNTLGRGTRVFLNDGKGHFTPAPGNESLNAGRGGTSLALADVDGDGDLDLYIANYRTRTIRDEGNPRLTVKNIDGRPTVTQVNGVSVSDPEWKDRLTFHFGTNEQGRGKVSYEENGEADLLCLNDGHGVFTPVSWTEGRFKDEAGTPLKAPPLDWGLSVLIRDLNGDGFPDIYVCNDFKSPDRIWINDGKGFFQALSTQALRQTSFTSMGVDAADINRDGHIDLFVADMLARDRIKRQTQLNPLTMDPQPGDPLSPRPQTPRNTLFLGRGDGTFAEIAQMAGVDASDWAWAPVFLDVDLDGYEDLILTTGFEREQENIDITNQIEAQKRQQRLSPEAAAKLRRQYPRWPTGVLGYHNQHGARFEDQTKNWGLDTPAVTQGIALADLDNDGDQDVVVNSMNGPALIFRNESVAPRVAVRLKGRGQNSAGVGARIRVVSPALTQQQEIISGGRYLSSDEPQRVFALPTNGIVSIEITWRSGRTSTLSGIAVNTLYEFNEAEARDDSKPLTPADISTKPWFIPVESAGLPVHRERDFDDFQRQHLLNRKWSTLGPGIAWADVDQDGWEDLLVARGDQKPVSIHLNRSGTAFHPHTPVPPILDFPANATAIVSRPTDSNSVVALIGLSHYRDPAAANPLLQEIHFKGNAATSTSIVDSNSASTGPIALGDLDGNGTLVLFTGGRVIPGQYPRSGPSRLWTFQKGAWAIDGERSRLLESAGLVSAALFSDLDGDGFPELILACEWGPIRVFQLSHHGKLAELTGSLGLARYTGWWNGVTVADLDEDGRLDIIASNWGRNTPFERYRRHPIRLYHGDLDQDGVEDLIESVYDESMREWVPTQPFFMMGEVYPFLQERFPSHDAYAHATVGQILGDRLGRMTVLEATHLESTVFMNRGNHFEAQSLPDDAQRAPAFGIAVGDFNGDGHEDLFLAQNFFQYAPEISRSDAGRGLCLRGDGQGRFSPLTGKESGVMLYGEQRAAAVADYDHDGRLDLVVTQNGGATVLFKNSNATPGLRIRLQGPPGNPDGIGAVIQLGRDSAWGPAREVHAGSGYWSQDAPTQIMTLAQPANRIRVRWPGGKTTESSLPVNAMSIRVNTDGNVVPQLNELKQP